MRGVMLTTMHFQSAHSSFFSVLR